jgi:predicted DNA-binding transcriptional regulator AlpA
MPLVHTEDLIDAQEAAGIIGLAQRNSVYLYMKKYPDMPRPVVDLGGTRPRLWLRPEIEAWAQHRQPIRRGRPRKSGATPAAMPPVFPDDKAPPLGGLRQRGGPKPQDAKTRPRPSTKRK